MALFDQNFLRRVEREPDPFVRTAVRGALVVYNATDAGLVSSLFERPCFVCGEQTWCRHREPPVVIAELRALLGAIKRGREVAGECAKEAGHAV